MDIFVFPHHGPYGLLVYSRQKKNIFGNNCFSTEALRLFMTPTLTQKWFVSTPLSINRIKQETAIIIISNIYTAPRLASMQQIRACSQWQSSLHFYRTSGGWIFRQTLMSVTNSRVSWSYRSDYFNIELNESDYNR